MRVFVTGGTGFIGGYVVRKLVESGHDLRCLVRTTSNSAELHELGVTLLHGDVTDKGSLLQGMEGCDAVVHLANVYSFFELEPEIYTRVNVDGTRNVLEAALETGCSKVVHVSSFVVYGAPSGSPFTEKSQVGPEHFSDYARSKYAGDCLAWDLHATQGLPLVAVYPGAVFGPGDTKTTGIYMENLLNRRIPFRVFDKSIMTYVYVEDVAEAIVCALETDGNIGERYLVGKEALSMREFTEIVCAAGNVPVPRLTFPDSMVMAFSRLMTSVARWRQSSLPLGNSVDQMQTTRQGGVFDGSKAARELGVSYTPVRPALERTVAWVKEHRS